MQRRPEKARQWLLRMNRVHCRNPEILQILSDLAAMQEYGVQKCGGLSSTPSEVVNS